MQHTAQLLPLPISLGGHAAEHDLLSVVVAHLRDKDLERTHLVSANRPHVTAVDGQCDRRRLGGWSGRLDCRFSLQSGTHAQGALTGRLDRWDVDERKELRQQHPGATVGQKSAHLCNETFVF